MTFSKMSRLGGRCNGVLVVQRILFNTKSFSQAKHISYLKTFYTYDVTKDFIRPSSSPLIIHTRKFILKHFYSDPSWGINLPGQGLKKKNEKEQDKLLEDKSIVLTYINNKIAEQEKGKEKFPILPDYKFYKSLISLGIGFGILGYLFYPTLDELFSLREKPIFDLDVVPDKDKSFAVYIYKHLPLRILSRVVGRINDLNIGQFFRPYAYKLYIRMFNVNMDEALVKDLTAYKTLNKFFSRPIDLTFRPIDEKAELVSPADGKILTFGQVIKGKVEQVKDLTYSVQKFLGPLTEEPKHDHKQTIVKEEGDKTTWKALNPAAYQRGLMHDPIKNDLYQCVVYLGPGDYHRFHSPADWILTHRRHIPGELLSVNPKIAKWVPNLFVVNERVVLSGEWDYGYFSMTAVGATNVGSIKIYADPTLYTNQARFKPGTYYDKDMGQLIIPKGAILGNFSFGSTIVLIFEAPKGLKFGITDDEKIKFGEGLTLNLNGGKNQK